MPVVNEITAPFYSEIIYRTPAGRAHRLRVFYQTGTTFTSNVLDANDPIVTGPGGLPGPSVRDIVEEIFSRAGAGGLIAAGTLVEQILNWQSAPGQNLFIGSNTTPTASYGTGATNPSSYTIQVWSAANRKKARFTFFDGPTANPQRYPGVIPGVDNGRLAWWVKNGPAPLATNDGFELVSLLSENVGYNRKLARSYGRGMLP